MGVCARACVSVRAYLHVQPGSGNVSDGIVYVERQYRLKVCVFSS